jgi:hypothetical protein
VDLAEPAFEMCSFAAGRLNLRAQDGAHSKCETPFPSRGLSVTWHVMLESLQIENFRGFEDSRVPLRETTIVVGGNNAGKSTLVEALRLVALVTSRFLRGTGRFVPPPSWLDHPAALFEGLSPALRGAPSDGAERNLFFRYGDPPALLTARFATGATALVFVGPESQLHGVARRPDGSPITRATSVHSLGLAPIAVQPQVAPLLREEPAKQGRSR